MSLIDRIRRAWSSRIEPGLYRGGRAAFLPADVVLSLLAKRSYACFRVWDRYAAATGRYFDRGGGAPDASAYDAAALQSMRERGYALAASGYDAAAVRAARDWVLERARRARDLAGASRDISTQQVDGIVAEVMPADGRVRLHFTHAILEGSDLPEAIRRFADDSACRALAAAYFNARGGDLVARVPYYIAEVMTPAEKLESWHIDCLRPTMKCFLLLDDVGEEQAPLRYIEGSQRVDEQRRQLFYRIARGGLGAAYFDSNAAAEYDRTARHMTAATGTLVAFDSRGIHAGSMCRRGARVALVNAYRPPRALRLSPRLFRDPVQTPYPWERVTEVSPRA
ncbi:MAG: hypothetical protein JWM53_2331 [bacterium]|nr:hypothetical protein [bacterium]